MRFRDSEVSDRTSCDPKSSSIRRTCVDDASTESGAFYEEHCQHCEEDEGLHDVNSGRVSGVLGKMSMLL